MDEEYNIYNNDDSPKDEIKHASKTYQIYKLQDDNFSLVFSLFYKLKSEYLKDFPRILLKIIMEFLLQEIIEIIFITEIFLSKSSMDHEKKKFSFKKISVVFNGLIVINLIYYSKKSNGLLLLNLSYSLKNRKRRIICSILGNNNIKI